MKVSFIERCRPLSRSVFGSPCRSVLYDFWVGAVGITWRRQVLHGAWATPHAMSQHHAYVSAVEPPLKETHSPRSVHKNMVAIPHSIIKLVLSSWLTVPILSVKRSLHSTQPISAYDIRSNQDKLLEGQDATKTSVSSIVKVRINSYRGPMSASGSGSGSGCSMW